MTAADNNAGQENIADLLSAAETALNNISDSARLDAEVLLALVLDKQRSYLRGFAETIPEPAQQTQFQTLLKRRLAGEPIAHITGRREFWSLDLQVNQHTLIPRPDTELLIEFVLENFPQQHLKLADLGTGSGAIVLAIASEKPLWSMTATDQSAEALKIAEENAQQLKLNNIDFQQGDWFDALNTNDFDIIISNPPYIPVDDPHLLIGDVRFEPASALSSGADGLQDIRFLIEQAPAYLSADGWLILEHGYDQKLAVAELLSSAGYRQIQQRNDYAGNARLSAAQAPKSI